MTEMKWCLQMKKPIAFLCYFLIILIYFLPLSTSAHSGRTDSNGGHTDKSTGEYHYHHGYPAHDHWDIDGDGTIDCPYYFDDKTSHNSGSSNNTSSSIGQQNSTDTSTASKEVETKVPSFIYWIIGILLIVIIVMSQIIRGKNETIANNERAFMSRAKDEETRVKEGITALHKALVAKYGKDYLYAISGANDGDFVGEDRYPHSASAFKGVGLDHYTFYLGGPPNSSVKYHHPSCRYARSAYPINAMCLQERRHYTPCTLCPCRLPDTSWVKKYKKHSEFINKYIDTAPLPNDSNAKINYRGRP